MKAVKSKPSAANCHEWRKKVKHHWHHSMLTEPLLPDDHSAYCRSLKDLSDLLGDNNDLFLVKLTMKRNSDRFGSWYSEKAIKRVIKRMQKKLTAGALVTGSEIYGKKSGPGILDRLEAAFTDI